MKSLIAFAGFFGLFIFLPGQELHSPAELVRIMENSEITYLVEIVPHQLTEFPEPKLNNSFTYQMPERDGFSIETYELSEEESALFDEAETAFAEEKYNDALGKYEQLSELNPEFAPAYTYAGQCLVMQGFVEKGMKAFEKALEYNYMDYLPHWFLADTYAKMKSHDKAAREVAIALVLNRNNPRLIAHTIEIFKSAGLKYQNYSFLPNYKLGRKGDEVLLRLSEEWMMYGLCKAIWAHEPGYRKRMEGTGGKYDLYEEKECLLNLIMAHKNEHGNKKSKFEEINALIRAVDANYINEFIFFELWLTKEPLIVYTQPREAIDAIADYVLEIRGKKK